MVFWRRVLFWERGIGRWVSGTAAVWLRGAPGTTKIIFWGGKNTQNPAWPHLCCGACIGCRIFRNSFVCRSPFAPPSSLCPPGRSRELLRAIPEGFGILGNPPPITPNPTPDTRGAEGGLCCLCPETGPKKKKKKSSKCPQNWTENALDELQNWTKNTLKDLPNWNEKLIPSQRSPAWAKKSLQSPQNWTK